jgi:hypothetical protein
MVLKLSQQLVLVQYSSSCHPHPPHLAHNTHTHMFTHGSNCTLESGLILWSLTYRPSYVLLSVLYRWLHLQVDEGNDSNSTDSAQPAARQDGSTGGQHNDTHTGVHPIVSQSSLDKWRKSAVWYPSLLESGAYSIYNSEWQLRRKVHIIQRLFLKFLNDGHSNHPNLNHINRTGTQSSFFVFLPPFSATGTLRSLPPICSRESILPNHHHEPFASPQRPWMWPSVYLSYSIIYNNDSSLLHTIKLCST